MILSFWHYWFFQSKNEVYLSVCVIFDFFHHCLEFSEYQSFVSLGRFIPRHFVFLIWWCIGLFLNFSFDLSLLASRKSRYFCVLIFYSATLPNSLVSSSSLLVVLLGVSMYSIMSSANIYSFNFFLFPLWIPFIVFSSQIAVIGDFVSAVSHSFPLPLQKDPPMLAGYSGPVFYEVTVVFWGAWCAWDPVCALQK